MGIESLEFGETNDPRTTNCPSERIFRLCLQGVTLELKKWSLGRPRCLYFQVLEKKKLYRGLHTLLKRISIGVQWNTDQ